MEKQYNAIQSVFKHNIHRHCTGFARSIYSDRKYFFVSLFRNRFEIFILPPVSLPLTDDTIAAACAKTKQTESSYKRIVHVPGRGSMAII